ncbi:MAG: lipid-A-disaccharide synthase [Alphaproteobacteria bacterium]|nr:lipid-A-disaccharide synthase [Alphaproteobacteria bacterium]
MATVLVSVGEASGDRLAAAVLEALAALRPGLRVRGLLGPALREAGHEQVAPVEDLSVMGVVEVLAKARPVLRARSAMRRALAERPDLLLAVDAPDFNLPLCRKAHQMGIPAVLLGAPQVWAWRSGRAAGIARSCADVLCLLPFEPELYAAHGGRAAFIGHPLFERRRPLPPEGRDWAILPGSRGAELERLLPTLVEAAQLLRRRHPGSRVRLPLAPGVTRARLEAICPLGEVELVGTLEEAVGPARACVAASGTVTLELAALGRPMVVCYRVHPLTYRLGRALVTGIEHIALPNLILGRGVVPEFIQDFDAAQLADAAEAVAQDSGQLEALAELRGRMGPPGAAARAAARVAERLP